MSKPPPSVQRDIEKGYADRFVNNSLMLMHDLKEYAELESHEVIGRYIIVTLTGMVSICDQLVPAGDKGLDLLKETFEVALHKTVESRRRSMRQKE